MTVSPRRIRVPVLVLALLCILIVVIFIPILLAMINFGNDYPSHIHSAMALETTGQLDRPIPQFLYHILLVGVSRAIPGGLELRFTVAAVIVGLACYLAAGLAIFYGFLTTFIRLPPRFRWVIAVGLTLALLLVGPINLLTRNSHNLYFGYLMPNTLHNPTIVLLKAFILPIYAFALVGLQGIKVRPVLVVVCALIVGLSILAKPNYGMALVPALLLLAAYAFWRKRSVNWYLIAASVIPVLAVLAWQYWYYGSSIGGGFKIAPFEIMSAFSPTGLFPKFLLSIIFPALVYLLYYREAHTRLELNLAWLTFAIAAVFAYFLAETNDWEYYGNFTWGSQAALFVLFIISALFLLRQNLPSVTPRPSRLKLGICVAVLALHLAGGLGLYFVSLYPGWQAWQ
jgi:hypothetical protein